VRTTRIFVARIPAAVSEAQFRGYFEQFGRLQDAYMPKDHSKQAYRGIGFVTFSAPEAVERVLSTKHWCVRSPGLGAPGARRPGGLERGVPQARLEAGTARGPQHSRLQPIPPPRPTPTRAAPRSAPPPLRPRMNGHEVAIDRATPKDDNRNSGASTAADAILRPAGACGARRSFDNGAGIVGPGRTPLFGYGAPAGAGGMANPAAAAALLGALGHGPDAFGAAGMGGFGHEHGLPDLARAFEDLSCGAGGLAGGVPQHFAAADHLPKRASAPGDAALGGFPSGLLGGLGGLTTSAALQNLAKAQAALGPFGIGVSMGMGLPGLAMGMGLDMPPLFGGAPQPFGGAFHLSHGRSHCRAPAAPLSSSAPLSRPHVPVPP
jgi:hypothetical protein